MSIILKDLYDHYHHHQVKSSIIPESSQQIHHLCSGKGMFRLSSFCSAKTIKIPSHHHHRNHLSEFRCRCHAMGHQFMWLYYAQRKLIIESKR